MHWISRQNLGIEEWYIFQDLPLESCQTLSQLLSLFGSWYVFIYLYACTRAVIAGVRLEVWSFLTFGFAKRYLAIFMQGTTYLLIFFGKVRRCFRKENLSSMGLICTRSVWRGMSINAGFEKMSKHPYLTPLTYFTDITQFILITRFTPKSS